MAGTILIDSNSALALNSIGYDRIVEGVRAWLDAEGSTLTSGIFRPNDLEGMTFISLGDADRAAFMAFHAAARAAHADAITKGHAFAGWNELLARLAADPRSRSEPSEGHANGA